MSVVRTRFICACLIMLLTLVGNASDWFICFHEDGWAHTELAQETEHCCHAALQHVEEKTLLECEQCIDVQFKTVEFLANREEGLKKSPKPRELISPPIRLFTVEINTGLQYSSSSAFRKTTNQIVFLASTHWIHLCPKVVIQT